MPDNVEQKVASPPSLSDAIEKIMANPQLISMVASTLGAMKNAEEKKSADTAAEPEEVSPVSEDKESASAMAVPEQMPDLSALVSSLAPMMSKLGGSSANGYHKEFRAANDREALLCALKPYVSAGRREAIDYIIRISQISDVLRR